MGVFYFDGAAVPKDLIKSYGHFYFLTTYDNDQRGKTINKIIELKQHLSPAEIKAGKQEAQKLMNEYRIE
jgi:hypothetical protein